MFPTVRNPCSQHQRTLAQICRNCMFKKCKMPCTNFAKIHVQFLQKWWCNFECAQPKIIEKPMGFAMRRAKILCTKMLHSPVQNSSIFKYKTTSFVHAFGPFLYQHFCYFCTKGFAFLVEGFCRFCTGARRPWQARPG